MMDIMLSYVSQKLKFLKDQVPDFILHKSYSKVTSKG